MYSTQYQLPIFNCIYSSSLVLCSHLSTPANIITNTSSNAPGITVQFFCTDGGKISGNTVISCLHNGSWSGLVPSCVGGSTGKSLISFSNCCQITYLPNIALCPDVSIHYHGSLSYYSLPSLLSCMQSFVYSSTCLHEHIIHCSWGYCTVLLY